MARTSDSGLKMTGFELASTIWVQANVFRSYWQKEIYTAICISLGNHQNRYHSTRLKIFLTFLWSSIHVMWVHVTTAWCVLGFWEEKTASRYGG
jgi:hypothetical protein